MEFGKISFFAICRVKGFVAKPWSWSLHYLFFISIFFFFFPESGSVLKKFVDLTCKMSPQERGVFLETDEVLLKGTQWHQILALASANEYPLFLIIRVYVSHMNPVHRKGRLRCVFGFAHYLDLREGTLCCYCG